METNIETFFGKPSKWVKEFSTLRGIISSCGLDEELKWGKPCYTYNGRNVVLIHGFKEYCALLFHKGALLEDINKMLIQQTPNVQLARQLRFTEKKEIVRQAAVIKSYIYEAIEVERAGLQVTLKKTEEYNVPIELLQKFDESPDFKKAFEALTPGRQRGYLLYFSSAKQSKTVHSRIEKSTENIFRGIGYNER